MKTNTTNPLFNTNKWLDTAYEMVEKFEEDGLITEACLLASKFWLFNLYQLKLKPVKLVYSEKGLTIFIKCNEKLVTVQITDSKVGYYRYFVNTKLIKQDNLPFRVDTWLYSTRRFLKNY